MKYVLNPIEALEPRALLTQANPVLTWNGVALQAIRTAGTNPVVAARDLAIVQASVYDAVNSIVPTGPSYLVRLKSPRDASAAAAVDGAAHNALVTLFPKQAATFDAALSQSLAALPPSHGTGDGLAIGQIVAQKELAVRAGDGSNVVTPYSPGTAPGQWQPTPPAYSPALLPGWGNVRPFVLPNAQMFKTPGPPTLSSPAYAAALNQVKALGAKNSTVRTPDQTQIALFWSDGTGTATPPGHWNEIAAQVATTRHDSLVKDARVFALLDLALADAGIACWNVKYRVNAWRPVTAIRAAGTTGDAGVTADPTWTPLLTTPAFPSYLSGHSTFSSAASAVLSSVYGANVKFTIGSDGLPGVTRSFSSFQAAAAEAGLSRIFGGIHFSFDNLDGLSLGKKVGQYVLTHALTGPTRAVSH